MKILNLPVILALGLSTGVNADIIAPDVLYGDTVNIDINYLAGGFGDDDDPGTADSTPRGDFIINGTTILSNQWTWALHTLTYSLDSSDPLYTTLFPTPGDYLIEVTAYVQHECTSLGFVCDTLGEVTTDGPFSSTLTLIDTSPVPVPAAVWLFGSGLIGLIGVAKRKKT